MRGYLYYFGIAFLFLVLEATIFSSFFAKILGLIGLDSISYFTASSAFIICVYAALTRNFKEAIIIAFGLGYLQDLFVLSGAWLNPFIFAVCAVISSVLKRVMLIKGIFTFSIYVFCISIFYCLLWMVVTYNIFSNNNAFSAGIYAMFPNALLNAFVAWVFYLFLSWFDSKAHLMDSKKDARLVGRA